MTLPRRSALGAAALYAGLAALSTPRGIFAFDPDEGINAIKASLVARGDALYTQIWSDQPPLFTHLLRGWFTAFGWDVDTGRLLVLLFGAACIFALYEVTRLTAGHVAALSACFLLATSAYFARLSVSLMLGVPALACGVLALWALYRARLDGGWGWIAAAGVLMGCSLATKLFTAVLLPAFAIWLAMSAPGDSDDRADATSLAVVWLIASIVAAGVLLLFLVGPAQLPALFETHRAAHRSPLLGNFGPGGLVLTALAEWPLTVLGLAGHALVLHWRLRLAAVFPIWAFLAGVALMIHKPFWYHHQLLLTLPHCGAAGVALGELFRSGGRGARLDAPRRRAMRIAALALMAALPIWSVVGGWLPAPMPMAGSPERVLAAMRQFAAVTRVVVAGDPMYAFRAGYAVPPELAAMPLKRVATDAHLRDDIRAVFARDRPEQVVLSGGTNSPASAWIREAMADRYVLVLGESATEVFVRGDLIASRAR